MAFSAANPMKMCMKNIWFFSKSILPTESCFLDGKKPNIAKLVDINFLADNEKNEN